MPSCHNHPGSIDASTLVQDAWELFELSNDTLLEQKTTLTALLEHAASAPQHSASSCIEKWNEWLTIIDAEMGERGVAYGIGKRLMSLEGDVVPLSGAAPVVFVAATDDGTVGTASVGCSDAHLAESDAARSTRVGLFDALLCTRPPWFTDVIETTSATPTQQGAAPSSSRIDDLPRRKGLWDDDDDDESPHHADDDAPCTDKQVRRSGHRRRGSRVATMNKMGFFVVPERRRKKAPALAPPPKPSRKPPLPSILPPTRTLAGADGTKLPSNKLKTMSTMAQCKSAPPTLLKRSATAIPFGSPRASSGASMTAPRPSSAEPLEALPNAVNATERERGGPALGALQLDVDHSTVLEPLPIHTTLDDVVDVPAPLASCAQPSSPIANPNEAVASGAQSMSETVSVHVATTATSCIEHAVGLPVKDFLLGPKGIPQPDSIEIATADVEECYELKRLPVAATLPSPDATTALQVGGTVESVASVPPECSQSASRQALPTPPAQPVLTSSPCERLSCTTCSVSEPCTSAPPRTSPSRTVASRHGTTSSIHPRANVAPFPSLESLMVDPTYLFTFDTQPIEVRKQGMRLLRRALCKWMGIEEAAPLQRTSIVERTRRAVRRDSGPKSGAPLAPLKTSKNVHRAEQHGKDTTSSAPQAEDDEVGSCLSSGAGCWYLCQTSHAEVYDLVTEVLEAMHDEDAPGAWRETPPPQHFASKGQAGTVAAGRRHPGGDVATMAPAEAIPACWNLWWTWGKPRVHQAAVWLHSMQYVNHIPKSWHLTKKDSLKANVQRYCRRDGAGRRATGDAPLDTFFIVPPTFVLPKEYVGFASTFAELRGTWIMKTIGMSRARGISLVSDISDVIYDAPVIVQRYIDRPLTIDGGYKFDLRLYVLVTSFQPRLEAFVSSLGFARIASYAYSATDLTNKYAHLTNTSVSHEAKSKAGDSGGRQAVPTGRQRADTKWTLERLGRHIDQIQQRTGRGPTWSVLWERVKECVLKSLVCVEDVIPHAPCTFELFGYDVLIDELFRPWVLEVNASPSLEVDCPEDEAVKPQVIEDTVALLDIPVIQRTAVVQAIDRRLADAQFHNDENQWAHEWDTISGGWRPRSIGTEPPKYLGNYEVLAPSPRCTALQKAKRSL